MTFEEIISLAKQHEITVCCPRHSDIEAFARAIEARRTVSGQPIYQVISRGVCQDVTKEQYDACEGKRYERRILYAAPIPATVSGQNIERVAEPESKAWAAAQSMGCADWIKEWVPQLRTVSGTGKSRER